ncbi:MAG: response regulator [Spirochaetes bacterium]|nr:response regulator [Spirochaetota bacterium]MBU1079927.1 response regulator [Spirochaetota bacterium]
MAPDLYPTILLVEDDALIALHERETLQARGYSVIVARSGEDALRALEDSGDAPARAVDMVLMDIDLGAGMDGVETAASIIRSAAAPVMFLSSHTDEETLQRLAGLPSYGYVDKGSGDAALAASVAMALNRVRAEKTALAGVEADYSARLAESQTRIREAHHRVRNNLSSIKAIMSMQLDTARSGETVSALQDAVGRLEGMSALYEMLALDDRGSDIAVKPYIEGLVDTIVPLFPFAPGISVDKNVDDFDLDPKRLFALGIIVNELLTNVMKYAFAGKDEGSVRIDVDAYDETVIMTLRDDGIGLPASFDPKLSGGLGLSLISMLLEQFGGTLSMRSDNGTTSTVLIKAPGLPPRASAKEKAPEPRRSAVA